MQVCGWWWELRGAGPQPSSVVVPINHQRRSRAPSTWPPSASLSRLSSFLPCEKLRFSSRQRTRLMVQLSPRGRAVRAKKPGNHCCVLGFQAHTHLSQGWNLPTKSYLLARYNYYFEHFQTAYQDVITQDVTMPLDSSKHPPPTSIKRVADPSNLNWCLKQSLTTTTADQSQW